MKAFKEHPPTMAMIGFFMCVPASLALILLSLGIEPDFGPLEYLLVSSDPDAPDVGGSLVIFALILLLPLAGIINVRHVMRAVRAGAGALSVPANLAVAIYAFAFTAMVISFVIADQYPCWIGVPNCD